MAQEIELSDGPDVFEVASALRALTQPTVQPKELTFIRKYDGSQLRLLLTGGVERSPNVPEWLDMYGNDQTTGARVYLSFNFFKRIGSTFSFARPLAEEASWCRGKEPVAFTVTDGPSRRHLVTSSLFIFGALPTTFMLAPPTAPGIAPAPAHCKCDVVAAFATDQTFTTFFVRMWVEEDDYNNGWYEGIYDTTRRTGTFYLSP